MNGTFSEKANYSRFQKKVNDEPAINNNDSVTEVIYRDNNFKSNDQANIIQTTYEANFNKDGKRVKRKTNENNGNMSIHKFNK